MLVQEASAVKGNAHGLKISRAHCVAIGRIAERIVVLFKLDAVDVSVAGEWKLAGEARGDDAGDLANVIQRLLEELKALSVITVITMSGFLHLHGEQVRGVEAGIDREQTLHA